MLSAAVLAGVSVLALRHGPSPKPVVLVPQVATPVNCGQVILASIVVASDVDCSASGTDGLIVGHAGITINLNGKKLIGNAGFVGINNFSGPGGPFATVTIENGTLSGWNTAVRTDGGLNKVIGIRATAGATGIILAGTGSSATGNVVFANSSDGIGPFGTSEKVTSNVVRENHIGISATGFGVLVQGNQVENNSNHGIDDQGTGTTFTGNIANGNALDGIHITSDQTATVGTNTTNYNGQLGIAALPGGKDGGGNLAKGNVTSTQCNNVVCS